MAYLLAHDLGTSGNKATLYDEQGALIASRVYPYPARFYDKVRAEQDPGDWWRAVCETTKEFASMVNPADIAALSFSAQMNGCLCVDKEGEPLHSHIMWADMRSAAEEALMRERIGNNRYYEITGNRCSASYSLFKLMWIKNHLPEVFAKTYKTLNAKDYVTLRLTGEYATDYSDGSLTAAMDINALKWSDELLSAAEIPMDMFPVLHASTDIVGYVTPEAARLTGLKAGTPVVAGGGDGSCACVGAGSIRPGVTYCCMGSSSWLATCTNAPIMDAEQRIQNLAHIIKGYVAPLGAMQTGGAALNWLKNTICGEETAKAAQLGKSPYELLDALAASSPAGANGVTFLPYLLGERSPRWNPDATAAFLGLKMENSKADIIRSVLEGVAYNLNIILSVFRNAVDADEISVIGGGAKGGLWRQILADVFGASIKKPAHLEEATSMGAAVTAGVGVGLFSDFSVVDGFIQTDDINTPNAHNREEYAKRMALFESAYGALKPLFSALR